MKLRTALLVFVTTTSCFAPIVSARATVIQDPISYSASSPDLLPKCSDTTNSKIYIADLNHKYDKNQLPEKLNLAAVCEPTEKVAPQYTPLSGQEAKIKIIDW